MVDLDAQALRNRRVRCLFANLAEVESKNSDGLYEETLTLTQQLALLW